MTARAVCLTILLALVAPSLGMASGVAVLISREIPPYVSMVEGLEEQLGAQPVDRYFLDKQGLPYSLGVGGGEFEPEQYDALVAVGPAALRYLDTNTRQVPLVFGMVLNPQKILTASPAASCGVTLNLPIAEQLSALLENFPDVTRLGVLFDPANNQDWYEDAVQVAESLQIELVPLQVQRNEGRLKILGQFSELDAILFIPDKTIISKAVIQHVIKRAVIQRIPVVGYNQFFYDSGATLAFIIDYRKVGQQVAGKVTSIFNGGPCEPLSPPAFDVHINPGAWQALQLGDKGGGL